MSLAKREVLLAGTWGDMHHTGAFILTDLVPGNHTVFYIGLQLQLVERPGVAPADKLRAQAFFQNDERRRRKGREGKPPQRAFDQPEAPNFRMPPVVGRQLHTNVCEFWMHRRRDV